MAHAFRLYRSGWSGDALPWPDNQLWARGVLHADLSVAGEWSITLEPAYGSVAALYRVQLITCPCAEEGWTTTRARLEINNGNFGWLPLSWYAGTPHDWPSGLARFPEAYGPQLPGHPYDTRMPRGVWTVAVNRSA